MIEIITRRFRLEEGEDLGRATNVIRHLPGYVNGTMHNQGYEIVADFEVKVI